MTPGARGLNARAVPVRISPQYRRRARVQGCRIADPPPTTPEREAREAAEGELVEALRELKRYRDG